MKSPYRSYQSIGLYNATLRVQDQGGSWSDADVLELNITDVTPPIPLITVNGVLIQEEISILTNQMILFSASLTVDNVPTQNLSFQWNWGDGATDGGIGMFEAPHEWGDINGTNVTYNLTLTVSDGNNIGVKNILVYVNNRIPYQIFSDNLSTDTYTSIVMPDNRRSRYVLFSFPDIKLKTDSIIKTNIFIYSLNSIIKPKHNNEFFNIIWLS